MTDMAQPLALLSMTGPSALRALARAFANFSEFDRFVLGLQAALDQSTQLGRLTIQLDRSLTETPGRFSKGSLTLPLVAGTGKLGTLQVMGNGKSQQFSADDLHLVAGLADFLSVALAQSLRLETAEKSPGLFRFLLDQAPIGIAAFEAGGRLIVANELAHRWLRETSVPFAEFQKDRGRFHLRASGKLIYGEARKTAEVDSSWIVVLHDLTADQVRLLEWLSRETYRALAESRAVGFALIESAQLQDGVLRRLPEVRAALLPGEVAGPYDAHRIGVIFPRLSGASLRARLRKLRDVFGEAGTLRLGCAELGRDGRTPEALLESALKIHGPYEEVLRPTLLVHDDSAAVTDTFAMILGKEFHVVKSTSPVRTRELLASETFEGFVTELELRNGVSGVELVRYAREKQPGIRPFFTTVQRAPYGLPAGATEVDASVLEKPFDIPTVTRAVRAKILD